MVARSLVLIAVLLLGATSSSGSQLRVEPRAITLDDQVEITLVLEGEFAAIDDVDLPLQNLVLDGSPSVSSEFRWMNGRSTRRKVLHYSAHAQREGQAAVGPLVLQDDEGRVLRLDPVVVTVSAAPPAPATPEEAISALSVPGRDPVFLTVEAEPRDAFVGQQIKVTWKLYVGEPVRDFRIASRPVVEGALTEEMSSGEQSPETEITTEYISGRRFLVATIRRVGLYPLRSGSLTIGPLDIVAQVVRRIEDPFGGVTFFEGNVENLRRKSQSLRIEVKPLPPAAVGRAIGRYSIRCGPPRAAKGPVVFDVTVEGEGNLRSAAPPRFGGALDAALQIEDRGTKGKLTGSRYEMKRTWRFSLYPKRSGRLDIPMIRFPAFDPGTATAVDLGCPAVVVQSAAAAQGPAAEDFSRSPAPGTPPAQNWRPDRKTTVIAAIAALAVLLVGGLVSLRRKRRAGREAAAILSKGEPLLIRRAAEEFVESRGWTVADIRDDASDPGEAWRRLESWLAAREMSPLSQTHDTEELALRIKDLVRATGGRGRRA